LRDSISYIKYRRKGSFSQHGEEEFLARYFYGQRHGKYIDIGCSHPFRISNSYGLYRSGWDGIAVDPIPVFSKLFRMWRPRDTFLNMGVASEEGKLAYFELIPSVLSTFDENVAKSLVEAKQAHLLNSYLVDVISPNSLMRKFAKGQTIDFLSIDVETFDFTILRAIDFAMYRPRLICVEFNTDDEMQAMADYLSSVGYARVAILGCNLLVEDTSYKGIES
jgi:hypothetical protein